MVRLEKGQLAQWEISYLGHIICQDGVKIDPLKIAAIKQWPTPNDARGLRGFLGITEYYKQFIKDYGNIVRLLNNFLKKNGFKRMPN